MRGSRQALQLRRRASGHEHAGLAELQSRYSITCTTQVNQPVLLSCRSFYLPACPSLCPSAPCPCPMSLPHVPATCPCRPGQDRGEPALPQHRLRHARIRRCVIAAAAVAVTAVVIAAATAIAAGMRVSLVLPLPAFTLRCLALACPSLPTVIFLCPAAPEVLTRGGYGTPSDVWSVGVITYILLCGFPPFYDEDNTVLFEQIKSGVFDFPSPYWDGVSETARDFVRRCLVVDPGARLTAKGVLAHPWVAPFAPRAGSDGAARPPSAAAAGSVSTRSLNIADNLRRFNARRKFREGVRKVQALQRFKRFGRMAAKRAAIQLADAAASSRARPASAAGVGVGGAGAAGAGAGSARGGAGAMPSVASVASAASAAAARPGSASLGVGLAGSGPALRPSSAAAPSRHSLSLPMGGGLYGSGGASPVPSGGHRSSLPLAGGLSLSSAGGAASSAGAVRSPFGGAGPVGVGVGLGLGGLGLGSGAASAAAGGGGVAGYSAASAYLGSGPAAASTGAGRASFGAVGAGGYGAAAGYGSGPAVRRY